MEYLNFYLKCYLFGRKCSRVDIMFCMYIYCVFILNRIRFRKYRNFYILELLDLEMIDVISVNLKLSFVE